MNSEARLNATFAALADPTRRAIMAGLCRGEMSVSQIAEPLPMSMPAVSKHLRVLERAGLVTRVREGRVHRLSARPERLQSAEDWISSYRKFWNRQLDALDAYLNSTSAPGKDDTP